MVEGYHGHQYSDENQEAAIAFLNRHNQLPATPGLPSVSDLDEKSLQCTRTGQVMLDFNDARSLMDLIRDYYLENKKNGQQSTTTLKQLYYGDQYPEVRSSSVSESSGTPTQPQQINWEARGSSSFDGVSIDKYLLHHNGNLEMPLIHIHKTGGGSSNGAPGRLLLWFNGNGKATNENWTEMKKYLDAGYDIVSFDFRGLGETRMPYKAMSEDDPSLAKSNFDEAYVNPLSSVLAGYVYNSLLTGRPYFLQMIEDAEIAERFSRLQLHAGELFVAGAGDAEMLASSITEVLPDVKPLPQPGIPTIIWSEIVEQKREIWPIQYLLPGGAYIH
jgi:hypothetical protein